MFRWFGMKMKWTGRLIKYVWTRVWNAEYILLPIFADVFFRELIIKLSGTVGATECTPNWNPKEKCKYK